MPGAADRVTDSRTTLPALIAQDALDPELGALLWMLVEGQVSVLVCGPAGDDRSAELLGALADLRAEGAPPAALVRIEAGRAWGAKLLRMVRTLRAGDALLATMEASSLKEVVARLSGPEVGLTEDELRVLGLVIVLDATGRVSAAHLLRPIERDAAGHLQQRPPAVLAARDPATGELEHFAWGVMPELADRIDREQGDLERRQTARGRLLATMAADGQADPLTVRVRLEDHLRSEPSRVPAPERPPARDPWPATGISGSHSH